MSIRKRGDKFVVLDSEGNVKGTHSSRSKAKKQLQAIELSKLRQAGKHIPKPKK